MPRGGAARAYHSAANAATEARPFVTQAEKGRASSLVRIAARFKQHEDTGAGRPILIFYAGCPAPMCGGFCSLRPTSSGARSGFYASSGALKPSRGGPVVLPDGRVTRRLILLHARRFRRARVSGRHPFANTSRGAAWVAAPQAPLPAHVAGTHSGSALARRRGSAEYAGGGGGRG